MSYKVFINTNKKDLSIYRDTVGNLFENLIYDIHKCFRRNNRIITIKKCASYLLSICQLASLAYGVIFNNSFVLKISIVLSAIILIFAVYVFLTSRNEQVLTLSEYVPKFRYIELDSESKKQRELDCESSSSLYNLFRVLEKEEKILTGIVFNGNTKTADFVFSDNSDNSSNSDNSNNINTDKDISVSMKAFIVEKNAKLPHNTIYIDGLKIYHSSDIKIPVNLLLQDIEYSNDLEFLFKEGTKK